MRSVMLCPVVKVYRKWRGAMRLVNFLHAGFYTLDAITNRQAWLWSSAN